MTDVVDGTGVQRTAARARSLIGVPVCAAYALNGGGEGEDTAVEDVHAALPGDDIRRVQVTLHVHGRHPVAELAAALSEMQDVHAVLAADANAIDE